MRSIVVPHIVQVNIYGLTLTEMLQKGVNIPQWLGSHGIEDCVVFEVPRLATKKKPASLANISTLSSLGLSALCMKSMDGRTQEDEIKVEEPDSVQEIQQPQVLLSSTLMDESSANEMCFLDCSLSTIAEDLRSLNGFEEIGCNLEPIEEGVEREDGQSSPELLTEATSSQESCHLIIPRRPVLQSFFDTPSDSVFDVMSFLMDAVETSTNEPPPASQDSPSALQDTTLPMEQVIERESRNKTTEAERRCRSLLRQFDDLLSRPIASSPASSLLIGTEVGGEQDAEQEPMECAEDVGEDRSEHVSNGPANNAPEQHSFDVVEPVDDSRPKNLSTSQMPVQTEPSSEETPAKTEKERSTHKQPCPAESDCSAPEPKRARSDYEPLLDDEPIDLRAHLDANPRILEDPAAFLSVSTIDEFFDAEVDQSSPMEEVTPLADIREPAEILPPAQKKSCSSLTDDVSKMGGKSTGEGAPVEARNIGEQADMPLGSDEHVKDKPKMDGNEPGGDHMECDNEFGCAGDHSFYEDVDAPAELPPPPPLPAQDGAHGGQDVLPAARPPTDLDGIKINLTVRRIPAQAPDSRLRVKRKLAVTADSRIVKCAHPNCPTELLLRHRYGRDRLLNHARTHSTNSLPFKCKICDYSASTEKKVSYHHKIKHADIAFSGTNKEESVDDFRQLLELFKICFPGALCQNSNLDMEDVVKFQSGKRSKGPLP